MSRASSTESSVQPCFCKMRAASWRSMRESSTMRIFGMTALLGEFAQRRQQLVQFFVERFAGIIRAVERARAAHLLECVDELARAGRSEHLERILERMRRRMQRDGIAAGDRGVEASEPSRTLFEEGTRQVA